MQEHGIVQENSHKEEDSSHCHHHIILRVLEHDVRRHLTVELHTEIIGSKGESGGGRR